MPPHGLPPPDSRRSIWHRQSAAPEQAEPRAGEEAGGAAAAGAGEEAGEEAEVEAAAAAPQARDSAAQAEEKMASAARLVWRAAAASAAACCVRWVVEERFREPPAPVCRAAAAAPPPAAAARSRRTRRGRRPSPGRTCWRTRSRRRSRAGGEPALRSRSPRVCWGSSLDQGTTWVGGAPSSTDWPLCADATALLTFTTESGGVSRTARRVTQCFSK